MRFLVSFFFGLFFFVSSFLFFLIPDAFAQGTVSQICQTDADCGGGGRKCVAGSGGVKTCSAATKSGSSCADNSGCSGGLVCTNGQCVSPSTGTTGTGSKVIPFNNPLKVSNEGQLLSNIINYVLGFVAVIAAAVLIYGGIMYMTAAGSDERINQGKTIIVGAIVGLILTLTAGVIVQFVINAVGG